MQCMHLPYLTLEMSWKLLKNYTNLLAKGLQKDIRRSKKPLYRYGINGEIVWKYGIQKKSC